MNEPPRLSDQEVTEMLRRRSARPAPAGLASAVLESLASERARHPARTAGRSARGPLVLLAAAALLLVGGALAAGSGLLRRPAVVPPEPAPSLAAVVAPSPRPSASARPAAGPGGTWIRTGSMINPGDGSLVRLLDGRVLATGGDSSDGAGGQTAELYDPVTGTWSATGSTIRKLAWYPLTLLADGRVLAGDTDGAELYDPATGTWSASATAKPPRNINGPPIALRDGRVLTVSKEGAQVFDPVSDTWTVTGKMVTPRYLYTATLLPDGRVLVAGGLINDELATDSAELYDPATNSWSATGSMVDPGAGGSAFLLRDGRVLVGDHQPGVYHPGGGMELYDPATGRWTVVSTPAQFGVSTFHGSLIPLPDGTVLVMGPDGAEVYDPTTGSWTTAASPLPSPDGNYPARPPTLLLDGTVLFTGDSGSQLYVPAGVAPPTGLTPVPSPTPTPPPTPTPTPAATPFPPAAGPIPQGARPWEVTVENRSSKPATLFLAMEPLTDMSQLCGSVTPDVVPAHTTEKVLFELPPKGVAECWLMIRPRTGAGGQFGPTDNWPIPGKLIIGVPGENGDNLSTVWAGP